MRYAQVAPTAHVLWEGLFVCNGGTNRRTFAVSANVRAISLMDRLRFFTSWGVVAAISTTSWNSSFQTAVAPSVPGNKRSRYHTTLAVSVRTYKGTSCTPGTTTAATYP